MSALDDVRFQLNQAQADAVLYQRERDALAVALRAIAAIGSERGTFDSIDAERACDIATNALKAADL